MTVSKNLKENVFIRTYQIIIFQINIMESTNRSRSRSPMNLDTQKAKLKNDQRKLTKVIFRKSQNPITMNPLKTKEIEIVQNQIMMNLHRKAQRTSECMKSIF